MRAIQAFGVIYFAYSPSKQKWSADVVFPRRDTLIIPNVYWIQFMKKTNLTKIKREL